MSSPASPNCIDIVAPLIDGLASRDLLGRFQLMGGIGSAALKHPGTEILPDERRIVTAPDFLVDNPDINPIRPNGTLRDMDALVVSSDEAVVGEVEKLAKSIVGDQLDVEIFPIHDVDQLRHQRAHPFGVSALKTFVSDRFEFSDGSLMKGLVPFAVEIPQEAMASWVTEIDGRDFPVLNPAAAILNYLTRSISGLRFKDAEKVHAMTKHIAGIWPEMTDWMMDGPGKSQMELAAIFQTLRHSTTNPRSDRTLDVGGVLKITAGSVRALREHEAFLFKDSDRNLQDATLAMAIAKSRGVGRGESYGSIVAFWQTHVEPRIGTITKNK